MKEGTIYKIVTNHNGFVYIGQTIQNLRRRWHKHLSDLKSKTHHNQLLQKVYDKYGEQDFVFEVIEKCNIAEIDERERYWINFYDSTNREKGYNFESGGNENKKHCAETIEKMKIASRGHNNKLTPEQVTEIKKGIINGLSFKELAEKFNVSDGCIYRIKILENWEYVSSELNELLKKTDTSRKDIKRLTKQEIEEFGELILKGEPPFNLAKQIGIGYKYFCNLFKKEIDSVKNQREELTDSVRELFFKNLPINKILEMTGATYPQYKRITFGLEKIRRERNIEYVGKSKAEGKTNPEIAKDLNLNRCTITVYWKEYKQKYADTVISQEIKKS